MTKVSKEIWDKAQAWEAQWHHTCINSFNEERKQLEYARLMGLQFVPTNKTPYNFDLKGKSILDIGGGAYSLLLKCTNFSRAVVADPLMNKYPSWVRQRYTTHSVEILERPGEKLDSDTLFDEVWFYNVLEHTYNPKLIARNALQLGKIVRVFEWIDTSISAGHIQTLTEKNMNKWLEGEGRVKNINKNGAHGKAYFGIFKGKTYEET